MKDGGRHGAYVDPSLTRHSSSVLVNRQDQFTKTHHAVVSQKFVKIVKILKERFTIF